MAKNKIKCWVEAMRLRTLPVSAAGVAAAMAYALLDGRFNIVPAMLCLAFALLAQTASNFANEYYDFKAGLDRAGRQGPRRGVTEGDISPRAMLAATYVTLGVACATGLSLICFSGWWLLAVGITVALGVLAYSTGPYPLSHHALGELAVVFFFGIIPVNFTFRLITGVFDTSVAIGSVAIGLMGANVLIVNNYRDLEDDFAVGKRTLAVVFGRRFSAGLYFANGWAAALLFAPAFYAVAPAALAIPAAYALVHTLLWLYVINRRGAALNPLLGMTAMAMALFASAFLVLAASVR